MIGPVVPTGTQVPPPSRLYSTRVIGDPPLDPSENDAEMAPSRPVAEAPTRAPGAPGVTMLTAALGAPAPAAFSARICTAVEVPLPRPVSSSGLAPETRGCQAPPSRRYS